MWKNGIFRKISFTLLSIIKHSEKHCNGVCEQSEQEIFVIFFGKNDYSGHFEEKL